jgi:hypothetical protein
MSRLLCLLSLAGLPMTIWAGSNPVEHRDCDLIPGDFGKPVVISLIPGALGDPWMIDDPDIIIEEDGPSEDDQGLIYILGPRGWQPVSIEVDPKADKR